MTTFTNARAAGGIARLLSGIGPQIALSPPNEDGSPTAEELAAAEATAREEEAARQAEADRVAAEAAEAERIKNLTDAEKAELVREVMDKKNKLKEEKAEKERLANELKKFEGIDPEVVRQLLKEKQDRELADAEAKGEFDRVKALMAETAAAEKKGLEDQLEALRGDLSKKDAVIDELTVGQNFALSSYIKEDLVLTPAKARQLYAGHFELKDGVLVGYDKPKGVAGRTEQVGSDGKPLSFDAVMKKIIEADPEKEQLLRVKGAPGAGSKTKKDLPSQVDNKGLEGLHGKDRIAALLARKAK